ncbi:MAG: LysM peptidoglycan-binding domain-containing protein [Thermodesulfovibrionales bacterium]
MRETRIIFLILTLIFIASTSHGETTYQVKKGDNLYSISRQFGTSVEDIMSANNMDSIDLKVGQDLIIPKRPEGKKEQQNIAKKTSSNRSLERYHVVKKGDNIWRIAKQYRLTVNELKRINGLESNSLRIGQKLSLVAKEEDNVESDDPISAIKTNYTSKKNPAISQIKIKELQEISKSEDISDLDIRERVILFAKKLLHLPYTFGGTGAFGVDCSAFVQKVYNAVGINLPRSAREQFTKGEKIDKEDLSKGDLVFFRTYASFPSHVGIYLGNNLFIHASTLNKRVTIDSMDTPYYVKRYIGAKRLLKEDQDIDIERLLVEQ